MWFKLILFHMKQRVSKYLLASHPFMVRTYYVRTNVSEVCLTFGNSKISTPPTDGLKTGSSIGVAAPKFVGKNAPRMREIVMCVYMCNYC